MTTVGGEFRQPVALHPAADHLGRVFQTPQRLGRRTGMLGVEREPEQQRAQQRLRPRIEVRPLVDQVFRRSTPRQRIDDDDSGGPFHRSPERHELQQSRRALTVEQQGAEQITVDNLGRRPELLATFGQSIEQITAGTGGESDRPFAPSRGVSPGNQIVTIVEQPRAAHRCGRRVQTQGRGDHVVKPRFRGTRDVLARREPGHDPTPVRPAQRPGYPQPVSRQRVEHSGGPRRQSRVPNRSDENLAAAPRRHRRCEQRNHRNVTDSESTSDMHRWIVTVCD